MSQQPKASQHQGYDKVDTSDNDSGPGNDPQDDAECIGSSALCLCITISVVLWVANLLGFGDNGIVEQLKRQNLLKHKFIVHKLVVSHFNSTPHAVVGESELVFNVTNLSPYDMYYETGLLSIYYKKHLLWSTSSTTEFYQGVLDSTLVNISIPKSSAKTDSFIPGMIARNRKIQEDDNFKVRFEVFVREDLEDYNVYKMFMVISCDVKMKIRNETTMEGGSEGCHNQGYNFEDEE